MLLPTPAVGIFFMFFFEKSQWKICIIHKRLLYLQCNLKPKKMDEEKERIRQELLKELEQLTKYYKEVSARGKQIKKFYDNEISRIVKALKELGV